MRQSRRRRSNQRPGILIAAVLVLAGVGAAFYWHHSAGKTLARSSKQTSPQTIAQPNQAPQAAALQPPPPQDANMPNLYTKTLNVNQKQSKQGVTVALDKVVFLQQDMLAVISVQNGNSHEVQMQFPSTGAMQAGQTYKAVPSEQYPMPADQLQAGATTKGVLAFHALQANQPVTLTFQAQLTSGATQLTPFVFSIP